MVAKITLICALALVGRVALAVPCNCPGSIVTGNTDIDKTIVINNGLGYGSAYGIGAGNAGYAFGAGNAGVSLAGLGLSSGTVGLGSLGLSSGNVGLSGLGLSSGGVALGSGLGLSSGGVAPRNGLGLSGGSVGLGSGLGLSNGGVTLGSGLGLSNGGLVLGSGLGLSSGGVALGGGLGLSNGGVALGSGLGAVSVPAVSLGDVSSASGSPLGVTTISPFGPSGLAVVSENVLEGLLLVSGELPFLSAVAFEGALPTAGSGVASCGCGSGSVGVISEGFPGSRPAIYF